MARGAERRRRRLSARDGQLFPVDNKEGEEHAAFVCRLAEAAKEAKAKDEAIRRHTGEQLEGVLVKLSEDDAAVVRKATGVLPANDHAQACLPKR